MNVSMTWPEYLAGCCRIGGRLTRLNLRDCDVLLALLLSHPDKFTPCGQLVEFIWPKNEPEFPEGIIRNRIWSLRRRGVTIDTRLPYGYCIPREARGREPMKLAA